MMNPQTATARAINWNKVLRVTFSFAWAVAVLAFKLVLIAFSFVIGMLTSGKDESTGDDRRSDSTEDDDVIHKFDHESKYGLYKNETRF